MGGVGAHSLNSPGAKPPSSLVDEQAAANSAMVKGNNATTKGNSKPAHRARKVPLKARSGPLATCMVADRNSGLCAVMVFMPDGCFAPLRVSVCKVNHSAGKWARDNGQFFLFVIQRPRPHFGMGLRGVTPHPGTPGGSVAHCR